MACFLYQSISFTHSLWVHQTEINFKIQWGRMLPLNGALVSGNWRYRPGPLHTMSVITIYHPKLISICIYICVYISLTLKCFCLFVCFSPQRTKFDWKWSDIFHFIAEMYFMSAETFFSGAWCAFRHLKVAFKNMQWLHGLHTRLNHIRNTEGATKSASKASFQVYWA